MLACSLLDRPANATVYLAAPAVRKAFVGSVTDQGVAEAQVPVLLDEEVAEALPHIRRGRLRRERSIDEILREAGSNNRGTAKNAAVGRRELVDPRRHQALDRVRQLGDAARLARDRHQLGQEERVPARPLGQRLDLVRQKR